MTDDTKTFGDYVYEREGPGGWFNRQIRLEQARKANGLEIRTQEPGGQDSTHLSDIARRHSEHWRRVFRTRFIGW